MANRLHHRPVDGHRRHRHGDGDQSAGTVHNDSFGTEYDRDLNPNDTVAPRYPGSIYYGIKQGENIIKTVETVHVYLGSQNDKFQVDSVAPSSTAYIHGGAGADQITVGATVSGLYPQDLRHVDYVKGTLHLNGDAGNDTILIDDSGDNTANTGTYNGNSLTGLDMPGSIIFDAPDNTTIQLGTGDDRFYVPSTNAGLTTTLNTGRGFDTIYAGTTSVRKRRERSADCKGRS